MRKLRENRSCYLLLLLYCNCATIIWFWLDVIKCYTLSLRALHRPKNFTLDLSTEIIRINSSRAVFQLEYHHNHLFLFSSFFIFYCWTDINDSIKQIDLPIKFDVSSSERDISLTRKFTLLSSLTASIEIFRRTILELPFYTRSLEEKQSIIFHPVKLYFLPPFLETVTRNFDRILTGTWGEFALYALCKCECQCHQSEIRLTRSVKLNEAWWEPRRSVRFVVIDVHSVASSSRIIGEKMSAIVRLSRGIWKKWNAYF